VHPDAADVSNADAEGYGLPAHQWMLHSDANDLSAYFIRNSNGYIKMQERSKKLACEVLQHFTLQLLLTPVFLFTVSLATNLFLFLFLFNRKRKSDV